jgi:exodeoxyribonuclease V beta subunit
VSSVYRRNHAALPDSVLVEGLEAAICTPLGAIADGLRLADLTPADRLAELSFDLPFGPKVVTTAEIGQVLLATLPPDDPQRAYAQQLADGRFVVGLEGFLQGSIDAVLRIPDPVAGHRYVVVDYKTNRLHERDATNPIEAYNPGVLPGHMAHSDYPLQALLYSVALHRFLSWRLGTAYQPQQHLGGIAYLFVRGMVGAATPQHGGEVTGVFAWRPPAATVIALHRLIAGEPW